MSPSRPFIDGRPTMPRWAHPRAESLRRESGSVASPPEGASTVAEAAVAILCGGRKFRRQPQAVPTYAGV